MAQEQSSKDNPSDQIGNTILFENHLVRIWALAVEPGKTKGWHRHGLPYVIVPMTDGKIEIESSDGRSVRIQDKAGEPIWRDAGEVHDLRNLGETVYRNVLVEIKPQAQS
jgi:quercetin dioxygenase-like cupin family protein